MFISPILTLCDPFLKSNCKFPFWFDGLFLKFACFFHLGIFGFDLILVCVFRFCIERVALFGIWEKMGLFSGIFLGMVLGIALMAAWQRMMTYRSAKRIAKVWWFGLFCLFRIRVFDDQCFGKKNYGFHCTGQCWRKVDELRKVDDQWISEWNLWIFKWKYGRSLRGSCNG